MRAILLKRLFGLAAWGCVAAASCLATTPEPRNLSLLKDEIRAYVASGDYGRSVAEVAAQAEAWLEAWAHRQAEARPEAEEGAKQQPAVIFDLDETLLDNVGHMMGEDFGYVHRVWDDWVDSAKAPAIEPVQRVYQTARRLGVSVIFLSGRRERYRVATERNVRAIGCGDYAVLLLKPDDWNGTNGAFKLAERRRLAAEGFVLIANLGDQASDFEGGAAERDFKLPNPFYFSK